MALELCAEEDLCQDSHVCGVIWRQMLLLGWQWEGPSQSYRLSPPASSSACGAGPERAAQCRTSLAGSESHHWIITASPAEVPSICECLCPTRSSYSSKCSSTSPTCQVPAPARPHAEDSCLPHWPLQPHRGLRKEPSLCLFSPHFSQQLSL